MCYIWSTFKTTDISLKLGYFALKWVKSDFLVENSQKRSFELSLVLILDWNSKVCIFYNYCMKWPKWKNIDAEVTNNTGSRSKATIWLCQMVACDRARNTPPSQFVHKCNKNWVSNQRHFSKLTPFSIKISNKRSTFEPIPYETQSAQDWVQRLLVRDRLSQPTPIAYTEMCGVRL